MIIDCNSCEVRGLACSDCVVSVLLGPPATVDLDDGERAALGVLAGSGLVPPLRLVAPDPSRAEGDLAEPTGGRGTSSPGRRPRSRRRAAG